MMTMMQTLGAMNCEASRQLGLLQWFTVYTCANHERRVAERFDARNVEHFLPTYVSVSQWKDRRVKSELPLFPGYIFVRLTAGERIRVLEVPGVAGLVSFNRQPYPIPDAEIAGLRAGTEHALPLMPHPYLNAGAKVRVTRGPLEGFEGVLVRKKNLYRFVLSLHLIARSASLEIDAADIEPISGRAIR
jgi:transcription termination/antitermination protein NusG